MSFKDNGFEHQTTNDKNDEWKYSQTLMIPGKLEFLKKREII